MEGERGARDGGFVGEGTAYDEIGIKALGLLLVEHNAFNTDHKLGSMPFLY